MMIAVLAVFGGSASNVRVTVIQQPMIATLRLGDGRCRKVGRHAVCTIPLKPS